MKILTQSGIRIHKRRSLGLEQCRDGQRRSERNDRGGSLRHVRPRVDSQGTLSTVLLIRDIPKQPMPMDRLSSPAAGQLSLPGRSERHPVLEWDWQHLHAARLHKRLGQRDQACYGVHSGCQQPAQIRRERLCFQRVGLIAVPPKPVSSSDAANWYAPHFRRQFGQPSFLLSELQGKSVLFARQKNVFSWAE